MKNLFSPVIIAILCGNPTLAQNVGIGTNTPHASAALDITATNKGLLIPRVPFANRPASPATGLLIYQTNNTPGFYYYNGSSWEMMNFQLPYTGTTSANYALYITSTAGSAIVGISSAETGLTYGGQFISWSTSGRGVYGSASASTGNTFGGMFINASNAGIGVYGDAVSPSGDTYGGKFVSAGTSGTGVYGEASATSGITYGGVFVSRSDQGIAVSASNLATTGNNYSGKFLTQSNDGGALFGLAPATLSNAIGVRGEAYGDGGKGVLGYALSTTGPTNGVYGSSYSISGTGVMGIGNASSGLNAGVQGVTYSQDGSGGIFSNLNSTPGLALLTNEGYVQFNTLAGANTRMVVANASGRLKAEPIPKSYFAAFKATATVANTVSNYTKLTYSDALSTDIVIVTPLWESVYLDATIGVYWVTNEWRVFRQDGINMPLGAKFNVMVIRP